MTFWLHSVDKGVWHPFEEGKAEKLCLCAYLEVKPDRPDDVILGEFEIDGNGDLKVRMFPEAIRQLAMKEIGYAP